MNTIQVDILNPKASKLLKKLADMNLILIRDASNDGFLKLLKKLRSKGKANPITVEEITKEVELVRASRYAKSKK
jgi:hypothetical protein